MTSPAPVVAPPVLTTVAGSAVIAAVLTAAVFVGRPPVAAVVLVLQVAFAVGWLGLVGTSVGLVDLALVCTAAAAADIVLLHSRDADPGSLAAVIGVAYVAALLWQLARRQRTEVTSALVATASGVALCCAPTVLIPLGLGNSGRAVAACGLLSAGAALLVGAGVGYACLVGGPRVRVPGREPRQLIRPGQPWSGDDQRALLAGAAGLLAGALAALATSLVLARAVDGGDAIAQGHAVEVGLLSAAAAALACVAAVRGLPPGRVLGLRTVAACFPVLAAAPTAYVVARVVLG